MPRASSVLTAVLTEVCHTVSRGGVREPLISSSHAVLSGSGPPGPVGESSGGLEVGSSNLPAPTESPGTLAAAAAAMSMFYDPWWGTPRKDGAYQHRAPTPVAGRSNRGLRRLAHGT